MPGFRNVRISQRKDFVMIPKSWVEIVGVWEGGGMERNGVEWNGRFSHHTDFSHHTFFFFFFFSLYGYFSHHTDFSPYGFLTFLKKKYGGYVVKNVYYGYGSY